jgi:DNA repair protein RadC
MCPATGKSHWKSILKVVRATEQSGAHNYHNHPSGLSECSAADELITRRLKEPLVLIDVRVLDHLIIGETIYSFAEHGLL